MPIEYAPKLKMSSVPPIRIQGLAPSLSTDLCSAASIAPVSRRIAITPPAMKMRKMMSWAAAKPFGMASRKCQGLSVTTSSAPAYSKVPATTISRLGLSGYGWRSNSPCGMV